MALDFDLKIKNMVWYRIDKKQTTEDLLKLGICDLKRLKCLQENTIINGGLTWKRTFGGGNPREVASVMYTTNFIGEKRNITLSYRFNNNENISSDIQLVCCFPQFGGRRYWFICPNCKRKVAFLYGEKYFLCRHCHNLSYPTQQMGFMSRMFEQSRKYQDKVLNNGYKKKWIHYNTLEKYLDKSEDYEMRGLCLMYKRMKKHT